MNSLKLNNSKKILLTTRNIASILSINVKSAQVTASRYVKKGYLIRLKNDLYVPSQKLEYLSEEEFFGIANILQTPSYISLTTALSYYNLSTQQVRNFIESISLKRSKTVSAADTEFTFSLIKKELYQGFEKRDNFFIAQPEKALLDAIYLTALGRYNCDFDAIDLEKFDKEKIESYLKLTNQASKNLWQRLCKIYNL